jgi:hypothetical protein
MLLFSRISQNYFYIGKVKDRVYGLRDHGWLSVHGGLMTMGRHGRSGVQEIIMIARRERERERERGRRRRRSSGFSSIVPLGVGATEIATRHRLTEAVGGASMRRWFRTRVGEIGAEMDVVDNGGALVAPFIGP